MSSVPPHRGVDRRRFFNSAALGAAALVAAPGVATAQAAAAAGRARAPRTAGPSAADGGVSGVVAAHVVGARYEDLDAGTLAKAKLRLLDVIGCAIGSTRGEGNAALARMTAAGAGKPEATLLGLTARTSAREAAMANAVLVRSFDFEVMHVVARDIQVPSHHSPTTVMTALAMAERTHADGRAFVTALSVGDDLAARTLAASGIDFDDGWDGAPLHSTMAAAAIAARFLGADALTARHAMGMAADQISGTVQSLWDGGGAWKIQQGTAARNGIFSAELAKAGWTGMADPLTGPFAFYGQYTPGCVRPDLLTAGLGREWFGETYFKPYPSCAANHPTIECALALRQKAKLDPGAIASVRLLVGRHVLGLFIVKPFLPGPSLHSQANFSLRFACANALLRGSFRQEHYEPAAVAEPALADLLGKLTLAALPAGTPGVVLEVTTSDGRTIRETVPGHPRHYLDMAGTTPSEVGAKFRQQVAFAGNVGAPVADEIVRRVAAIEREPDMAKFAAMLARAVRFPS